MAEVTSRIPAMVERHKKFHAEQEAKKNAQKA